MVIKKREKEQLAIKKKIYLLLRKIKSNINNQLRKKYYTNCLINALTKKKEKESTFYSPNFYYHYLKEESTKGKEEAQHLSNKTKKIMKELKVEILNLTSFNHLDVFLLIILDELNNEKDYKDNQKEENRNISNNWIEVLSNPTQELETRTKKEIKKGLSFYIKKETKELENAKKILPFAYIMNSESLETKEGLNNKFKREYYQKTIKVFNKLRIEKGIPLNVKIKKDIPINEFVIDSLYKNTMDEDQENNKEVSFLFLRYLKEHKENNNHYYVRFYEKRNKEKFFLFLINKQTNFNYKYLLKNIINENFKDEIELRDLTCKKDSLNILKIKLDKSNGVEKYINEIKEDLDYNIYINELDIKDLFVNKMIEKNESIKDLDIVNALNKKKSFLREINNNHISETAIKIMKKEIKELTLKKCE